MGERSRVSHGLSCRPGSLYRQQGDSDGKTVCSVSFSSTCALGAQESIISPLKSQHLAKMALRDICQINQKQMSTFSAK